MSSVKSITVASMMRKRAATKIFFGSTNYSTAETFFFNIEGAGLEKGSSFSILQLQGTKKHATVGKIDRKILFLERSP